MVKWGPKRRGRQTNWVLRRDWNNSASVVLSHTALQKDKNTVQKKKVSPLFFHGDEDLRWRAWHVLNMQKLKASVF